jgi:DNA-binding transcriptional LysR family regulator
MPGIRVIPISEPTGFQTFVAYRRDATLTTAAEVFIRNLRQRMKALAARPRAAA